MDLFEEEGKAQLGNTTLGKYVNEKVARRLAVSCSDSNFQLACSGKKAGEVQELFLQILAKRPADTAASDAQSKSSTGPAPASAPTGTGEVAATTLPGQ